MFDGSTQQFELRFRPGVLVDVVAFLAPKEIGVRTHQRLIFFNEVANRVDFFPELLVSVQVSLIGSMFIAIHLILFNNS